MERMLKLCVIDDIRSVVDMIAKKIPWTDYGIEAAGTATDGEEGLAVIEAVKPDIVITDIRMPKLDGLEMTRRIMELLPGCKVIILSAYADFEYARKALRYGALNYLKKPFAVADIVKVVLEAKEAWLADHRERMHVADLERKMKESLPALRQEYLSLLVHHPTAEAESEEWWAFLELSPVRPPFAAFVIQIDQLEKEAQLAVKELELARFSLQNIVEETLASYAEAVVFREAFNRYVCIVGVSGAEPALVVADACCAHIARYTKFTISVGIGLEAGGVRELPRSYRQALIALSYHFYTGGNGAFRYPERPDSGPADWIYTAESENEFLFAFRSGNAARCGEWLDAVFAEMENADALPEPSDVEHLFRGLALRMLRVLLEKLSRPEAAEFEARVHGLRTGGRFDLRELRQRLADLCEIGCRLMDGERASESRKIIFRSMDYIKAHLHLDLTLESCARQVNLSWGYYSNLFKKVAGMTFQQFVTQAKIERAKAMLLEDYQVQEISQLLGYEHRRYFSELFKKQTGLTPTEFKESYLGKKN